MVYIPENKQLNYSEGMKTLASGKYCGICINVEKLSCREQAECYMPPSRTGVLRLLFLFLCKDDLASKITPVEFVINLDDWSALFRLFRGLLGKVPEPGYDYSDLKGKVWVLEIVNEVTNGNTYAIIAARSASTPQNGNDVSRLDTEVRWCSDSKVITPTECSKIQYSER